MATRSFIGKLLNDGSVRGIYCHHDGYPEGVGRTLEERYTSPEVVDALLSLGDISSLGDDLGTTEAYHRDRGEDLQPNTMYSTVRHLLRKGGAELGAEHAYVFEAGAWTHHKL